VIITPHTSLILHHISHITHHTSHITHHTSRITHHTSHILHHLELALHKRILLSWNYLYNTNASASVMDVTTAFSSEGETHECGGVVYVLHAILLFVKHHTSHITHHTSHVTHHTSHVTHHTSHITLHTLHFTHHTSYVASIGGAPHALIPLNVDVGAGAVAGWIKIALSIDNGEGFTDLEFTRGSGFTVYIRVGGKGGMNEMRRGASCDSGIIQV
jgi:hypothetical protein